VKIVQEQTTIPNRETPTATPSSGERTIFLTASAAYDINSAGVATQMNWYAPRVISVWADEAKIVSGAGLTISANINSPFSAYARNTTTTVGSKWRIRFCMARGVYAYQTHYYRDSSSGSLQLTLSNGTTNVSLGTISMNNFTPINYTYYNVANVIVPITGDWYLEGETTLAGLTWTGKHTFIKVGNINAL
jgi:hypothetical protein